MSRRLHIIVKGKVQGVGFRYFTQMKAGQYGITGWVKNLPNGDVEIVASGERENIEKFIKTLKEGAPFSKVTDVIVNEWEKTEPLQSFTIRY